MEKVIVSNSVANDFAAAKDYEKEINKETAHWLLSGYLDRFYEYALKRGWTKAKSIAEYVEKDHGPIYTAVFLKTI